MSKVVVVGSEGYLGRLVVKALRQRCGYDVLGVDALLWKDQVAGKGTLVGSACSKEVVEAVKDFGPECIVYLGAVAHDPQGKLGRDFCRHNTYWEPRLFRALFYNVPFVFASSMSVLDKNLVPDSYGWDKRNVELSLLTYGGGSSVLRFGTLWGPGADPESFREHLLLNSMVLGAMRDRKIVVRNPAIRRPLYHVNHAVDEIRRTVRGFLGRGIFQGGTVRNCYDTLRPLIAFGETVRWVAGDGVELVEEDGADTRDYEMPWLYSDLQDNLRGLFQWVRENNKNIVKKEYKNA